jgi:hypothetical protein
LGDFGTVQNERFSPPGLTVHQVRIKSCIDGGWLDEGGVGRDEEVVFVPFCFGSHFKQVESLYGRNGGVEALGLRGKGTRMKRSQVGCYMRGFG